MKKVDFSESYEACDLKDGIYKQLIQLMKVFKYLRSRSFLELAQGHLHMKIETCFSQKPLGHF